MKKARLLSVATVCLLGVSIFTGCTKESMVLSEKIEDGKWLSELKTDKALYNPGDQVAFTVELKENKENAKLGVVYKHLNQTIGEEEINIKENRISWEWTPPKDDFKGYMVEVFLKDGEKPLDHANIAVDVSSEWAKFPRYGYLADFYEIDKDQQEKVIDRLNRFHINGIQFYDWQYKHEKPLKTENGQLSDSWPDIANREVSRNTIEGYIGLAHEKNMKAMNYNLLFGAYENAGKEGVKKEWGLFKDPFHEEQDMHPLPDNWASDLYLYDPSNPGWQEILLGNEKEVFEKLEFDGWHVDQLGDRGTLWNYEGEKADLVSSYITFLEKAKSELDVPLVMNAVSQFGQIQIAAKAPVEFLYSELWDTHSTYQHLKDVIDQNSSLSKGKLNTVLAAYMNYDLSNSKGEFNPPGVLMTNAVIFASGGSHLELGENMLSKEYFPHKNLKITENLDRDLVRYYDFLTAYQNILRDQVKDSDIEVGGQNVSPEPKQGRIWGFAKEKEGKTIVHFINFTDAASMAWRDTDGTQPEPGDQENIEVEIFSDREVDHAWLASPDYYKGSAIDLDFKQKNGKVTITLPSLKYWDMVVLEYKK